MCEDRLLLSNRYNLIHLSVKLNSVILNPDPGCETVGDTRKIVAQFASGIRHRFIAGYRFCRLFGKQMRYLFEMN